MTGLKEGDLLVGQLEVDTLDTLLLFTKARAIMRICQFIRLTKLSGKTLDPI